MTNARGKTSNKKLNYYKNKKFGRPLIWTYGYKILCNRSLQMRFLKFYLHIIYHYIRRNNSPFSMTADCGGTYLFVELWTVIFYFSVVSERRQSLQTCSSIHILLSTCNAVTRNVVRLPSDGITENRLFRYRVSGFYFFFHSNTQPSSLCIIEREPPFDRSACRSGRENNMLLEYYPFYSRHAFDGPCKIYAFIAIIIIIIPTFRQIHCFFIFSNIVSSFSDV